MVYLRAITEVAQQLDTCFSLGPDETCPHSSSLLKKKCILILCFHPLLCLSGGLFPSIFTNKILHAFVFSPCIPHTPAVSLFNQINISNYYNTLIQFNIWQVAAKHQNCAHVFTDNSTPVCPRVRTVKPVLTYLFTYLLHAAESFLRS